jgi:hypothetical protein
VGVGFRHETPTAYEMTWQVFDELDKREMPTDQLTATFVKAAAEQIAQTCAMLSDRDEPDD